MLSLFSHTFMIYALLASLALAIIAALLSPYLVLSNQAMIADGLSHVAFTGVIIGFIFSKQPLYFAIPFVVVASIAITFLSEKTHINNDASISVIASFSLAIGLITASLQDGYSRSIESLLVGSILTIQDSDLILLGILVIVVSLFIVYYYRSLLSMTFDIEFAEFIGIKTTILKYSMGALTGLFVVIGIRMVGILLISAFSVFPTLIASKVCKRFSNVVIVSIIISSISTFLGIYASYYMNLPTGSTIVVVSTVIFMSVSIIQTIRKKT